VGRGWGLGEGYLSWAIQVTRLPGSLDMDEDERGDLHVKEGVTRKGKQD